MEQEKIDKVLQYNRVIKELKEALHDCQITLDSVNSIIKEMSKKKVKDEDIHTNNYNDYARLYKIDILDILTIIKVRMEKRVKEYNSLLAENQKRLEEL